MGEEREVSVADLHDIVTRRTQQCTHTLSSFGFSTCIAKQQQDTGMIVCRRALCIGSSFDMPRYIHTHTHTSVVGLGLSWITTRAENSRDDDYHPARLQHNTA
jgi:hypothetical protein